MSYITPPVLTTLPNAPNGTKRYALSFAYDFTTDPHPALQNIAGESFWGNLFSLTSNQAGSNLGALTFNSMAFTAQFDASWGTVGAPATYAIVDGPLYVQVPSTGQLHIFGMEPTMLPIAATPPGNANKNIYAVTGVIPILGSSPTAITFAKGVDPQGPGASFGKLWVTLLTDTVAPWIRGGFYMRTIYDIA